MSETANTVARSEGKPALANLKGKLDVRWSHRFSYETQGAGVRNRLDLISATLWSGTANSAQQAVVQEVQTLFRELMLGGLAGDATAQHRLLSCATDRLRHYFVRRIGSGPPDLDYLVQETLIADPNDPRSLASGLSLNKLRA